MTIETWDQVLSKNGNGFFKLDRFSPIYSCDDVKGKKSFFVFRLYQVYKYYSKRGKLIVDSPVSSPCVFIL